MASRKGMNISGHYVASINTIHVYIRTLNSKKLKGRTESYFRLYCLKTRRPSDTVF